jgi:hypothetical protein
VKSNVLLEAGQNQVIYLDFVLIEMEILFIKSQENGKKKSKLNAYKMEKVKYFGKKLIK